MSSYSPQPMMEWQCPPAAVADDAKLAWINSACEEGIAWIKSQRGFSDFNKALDTIAGRDTTPSRAASYRSKLNTNPLKRDVREIIGTLAKLRPAWGYHSDNAAYAQNAAMMNKVTRAVYLEQFMDLSIKDAVKYAAATNRGWLRPIYRRDLGSTGRGNIQLLTYGSPCVLPVQLPASGNFQDAYSVSFLDEMPVYMAHGMFPTKQMQLRASSSRYWYSSDNVRKSASGNILQRIFGRSPRASDSPTLTDLLVPMRYTYVIDLSINTTDHPIPMGEPGASWSYTVPCVGQDISMGTDARTNQMTYRKADENDARLYPYRRLLISSDTTICYDGPSFDWHGMFPGVSFSLDAWPWEPLGFSLVHEGYEINEAIKQLDRGNMDKAAAQLDPALMYDNNAVAKLDADRFDPLQPRARIGYDGSALEKPPFSQAVDPQTIKIDTTSLEFRKMLEESMHSQLAIKDVMALAKMRAVGSMDDLEKIMEVNGPIVEEMSRSMEPPMRDLGVMVKYLILQYYNTARVMQYVGEDGVTTDTFDYDPTSLVPSHLPGEVVDIASPSSRIVRARTFADNLRFFILPNSLHELSQMQMKLALLQMKKVGVKIDSQTIAEAFQVPNYGTLPGATVMEKARAEQEADLEFAARMKAIAGDIGLLPTAPPGAPKPGGGNPEGRPNANTAPASLQQKDGGTRTTMATSASSK